MIRLLKALQAGGHAAFLTDLSVKPTKAATVIECFGRKTCVTSLHGMLAKRTGLPVIPGICVPQEDGTYLVHAFSPLDIPKGATEQEIAQQCWSIFEPWIRKQPEPWLWMYKHWRFLPEGAESDSYPDYAQASKAFERVVRQGEADSDS